MPYSLASPTWTAVPTHRSVASAPKTRRTSSVDRRPSRRMFNATPSADQTAPAAARPGFEHDGSRLLQSAQPPSVRSST